MSMLAAAVHMALDCHMPLRQRDVVTNLRSERMLKTVYAAYAISTVGILLQAQCITSPWQFHSRKLLRVRHVPHTCSTLCRTIARAVRIPICMQHHQAHAQQTRPL
jgi:hypothetical protein